MTPLAQLEAIQGQVYVYEARNFLMKLLGRKSKIVEYRIDLAPGMSTEAISALAKRLPEQHLPQEIESLLVYCNGFSCPEQARRVFEWVNFSGLTGRAPGALFPALLDIAGDECGNFWIVDIAPDGRWGSVFYVCHDPAVIVKQADGLAQFIEQCGHHMANSNDDPLLTVCEFINTNIWDSANEHFLSQSQAMNGTDETLKQFASRFADDFFFIDFRNQPIKTGFSLDEIVIDGKTKTIDMETWERHRSELIWAFKVE